MSNGLMVWDAAGGLVLDVSDRLTRYQSSFNFSIEFYASSIDVSVPGVSAATHIVMATTSTPAAGGALAYIPSTGVVRIERSQLSYPDILSGTANVFRF